MLSVIHEKSDLGVVEPEEEVSILPVSCGKVVLEAALE